AVAWPRPPEFFAPSLQRCSMDDWSGFFQPMALRNVDSVRIAVVHKFDSREGMVPPKIHAADAGPMFGEGEGVNGEVFFSDREYSARTQSWNSLRACFLFMRRVGSNDSFLFIVAIMLHVINCHHRFVTVI